MQGQQQAETTPKDDGSDPYVSNGQSTIAPQEDPFEAARQQREADYNAPGPTEAAFVNEPSTGGSSGTKTVTTEDNTPWVTSGGWQSIYANNKDIIKNPDLIYPGQVLQRRPHRKSHNTPKPPWIDQNNILGGRTRHL